MPGRSAPRRAFRKHSRASSEAARPSERSSSPSSELGPDQPSRQKPPSPHLRRRIVLEHGADRQSRPRPPAPGHRNPPQPCGWCPSPSSSNLPGARCGPSRLSVDLAAQVSAHASCGSRLESAAPRAHQVRPPGLATPSVARPRGARGPLESRPRSRASRRRRSDRVLDQPRPPRRGGGPDCATDRRAAPPSSGGGQ